MRSLTVPCFVLGALLSALMLGSGCSSSSGDVAASDAGVDAAPPDGRLLGSSVAMFGGTIATWATVSGGVVTEVGVTIPMTTIDGAPAAAWDPRLDAGEMAPVLALLDFPAFVTATTFVNHLEVDWNALGHPPTQYNKPHFDIHFYRSTRAEVAAIDCTNFTEPPEDSIPAGYFVPPSNIPGVCVPKMGKHGSPPGDDAPGLDWDRSMIFGYYGGQFTFIEPMVSRESLQAKASFTLPLPAPPSLHGTTRFPAKFDGRYDATKAQYDFVLSDFRTLD